ECPALGAGRYSGRLGILVLPDGGVLHLRRRHDAARRGTHSRHARSRAARRAGAPLVRVRRLADRMSFHRLSGERDGALLLGGAVMLALFRNIPLDKLLAQYAWNILTTQELLALPMFILMGEILFQSRLSRALFQGLAPWAGLLPGRLLHVNVVGCSIFAAISGSSAATTQVVGRIALAELLKRGYSKDIAIGSLAGAGTLGFLIPPSNIMIIYGVLGDVSVLKLFTAGFIPGFLLAGCFMAWVMIHTTLRPGLVPETERDLRNLTMLDRIRALKELAPAMFLIASVLGSMYGGLATPSEAA